MRLLIVGGSDAGISAGLRARELDPTVEATLVVADRYPNFSICGIPYHVAGDVPDWRTLAHRSTAELAAAGLELLLDTTARRIDVAGQRLHVTGPDGTGRWLPYDQLVVATGAVPVRPPISGLDVLGPGEGVHLLHTMADTFTLTDDLTARYPRSALIVGAGYIGLEMAEALRTRGLAVTMVERLPQVLPTVDPDLGVLVAAELADHGVRVVTGTTVTAVTRSGGGLVVDGVGIGVEQAFRQVVDLVLVVVGVLPDTGLAAGAGAAVGAGRAIAVDTAMRTSLPHVLAAGDCVHTHHRLLPEPTYLPLGSTAHKQGRVAGATAAGRPAAFAGSLGTQVVKVFDLVAARTGLRDAQAVEGGHRPLTVAGRADDHKAYYPGATPIAMRWTGDRQSGRLLGVQLVGRRPAEIAKRVDVAAAALFAGLTVEQVSDLDLSYTPPLGSPWDALQVGAQAWTHTARRRTEA